MVCQLTHRSAYYSVATAVGAAGGRSYIRVVKKLTCHVSEQGASLLPSTSSHPRDWVRWSSLSAIYLCSTSRCFVCLWQKERRWDVAIEPAGSKTQQDSHPGEGPRYRVDCDMTIPLRQAARERASGNVFPHEKSNHTMAGDGGRGMVTDGQQKGHFPHASCVRACRHLQAPFEPWPGTVQGARRYSCISLL
jgi:hypothetical protein